MSDALERDTVIELLDRLGSEQDEEVLSAARSLHAQITASGRSWQDLLVGEDNQAQAAPVTEESPDNMDGERAPDEPAAKFTGDESQTLELIEKLMAREGNSPEFTEELEEYKVDLANGDFEPGDHRYIHALYARLTSRG